MANVVFGYTITQDELIVPNSVDLGNGLVAIDATGALTPEIVRISDDIYLLSTAGATAAQYAAAAHAYAKARGVGSDGSAGGAPVTASDFGVSPTPSALADGTWTPT